MPGRSVRESPAAPLVAFSAATNLGLAGRRVRVDDALTDASSVSALLRGFGAREAEPAELVVAGSAADPLPDGAVRVLHAPGRPPVVLPAPRRDAAARIDFARAHMPAARAAAAALGDAVRGLRIGLSLVLEPKTAVLALLLAEAGAEVDVFAFAAETDDAVAEALALRGIAVHASASATRAEERRLALDLLDARPQVLVDDGAHVIRLAHSARPDVVADLVGATEETTSGVGPLRAMAADGALRTPVIAANDAATKSWSDNRHGTGETCVLAIVRLLDDDLSGSVAVVAGFGPVGEGVAQRLAALGADVTVAERDPRRLLAARLAGHGTAARLRDAVGQADLVVSATGGRRTVDAAVLAACREDAAVAVAGGAPQEVAVPEGTRRERLGAHLERLHLPGGGAVRLLADGEAVNIAAGDGNPIDVMDLSFAVQLGSIRTLLERRLPPGVHALGDDADAAAAAAALGVRATAPHAAARAGWRRTRFDLPARS